MYGVMSNSTVPLEGIAIVIGVNAPLAGIEIIACDAAPKAVKTSLTGLSP